MELQPITLYTRPECKLCDEARGALRAVLAASPLPPTVREIDIEQDPALHQRLLTDVPAIEYRGALLPLATSRLRIESFLADLERRV
ncbi:MAG: glutaredoxin family protein [Candidatus Limnocylindrus sp.]